MCGIIFQIQFFVVVWFEGWDEKKYIQKKEINDYGINLCFYNLCSTLSNLARVFLNCVDKRWMVVVLVRVTFKKGTFTIRIYSYSEVDWKGEKNHKMIKHLKYAFLSNKMNRDCMPLYFLNGSFRRRV